METNNKTKVGVLSNMRAEIELLVDGASDLQPGRLDGLAHSEPDEDLMDAYSRAVITAAEKVSPSVVYIEVQQPIRSRRGNAPRLPQEARGSGSGVFFSPQRPLLAENHA